MTLRAPALAAFGASYGSPSRAAYARQLEAAQEQAIRNVRAAIPEAVVRWRYRVVVNGFAVVVPSRDVARLARVPGVATVWPGVVYHSRASRSPGAIGADKLWGTNLATAGNGIKIGIIDDGLDAKHEFFDGTGLSYPPGFPKGQKLHTTPKVIVQRTFPPASPTAKWAKAPFDPVESFHGTHVAGIAAGRHGTRSGGSQLSGVAPNAYLGNYKALTIPTPNFGLDGNAAEIAAAIEAAVADGMDVINLSLGEPEIEPTRDLVVTAIEAAARAGVVPVVAAGNDYSDYGEGSISSPANAPSAITVAAVNESDMIASFSSAGPTPISLKLKPDVSAPGVGVVSSLPPGQGGPFGPLRGTSMAAPHVAGAAALLRQQRPTWSVAQIKSALVQTADPAKDGGGFEASVLRQGGGVVNVPRALNPLLFAAPTGISFPVNGGSQTLTLTDAGGGAGMWTAAVRVQDPVRGVTVSAPATVSVPGELVLTATVTPTAAAGPATGFVVLTHGSDVRRVPFLLLVSRPLLGSLEHKMLTRPGIYTGTTKLGTRKILEYRYPTGGDVQYPGPEVVYRVRVTGRIANFGVAVLSGQAVPHVMYAGDENHLAGYPGLPVNLNPYFTTYGERRSIAGAVLPGPGAYDIVFDTRRVAEAGTFKFRFWMNDGAKPQLRVLSSAGGTIVVGINDNGAGVDPRSITALVDGQTVKVKYADGKIVLRAKRGSRRIVVSASDYQEAKNMEDVPRIKPNTGTLSRTVVVR